MSWQVITDPGIVSNYWDSLGLHHNWWSQHCSSWTTRLLLTYRHHSIGSSIVCWHSISQSWSIWQYTDNETWRCLESANLKEYVLSLDDKINHQISEGGENLRWEMYYHTCRVYYKSLWCILCYSNVVIRLRPLWQ